MNDLDDLRLKLKNLEEFKKNEDEKKDLEDKIKLLEKGINKGVVKFDFSSVFKNLFDSYFSKMLGLKSEVKWILVFGYVFPLGMFLFKGLWLVFFLYLIGYLFALPVMILKLVEKGGEK